MAIKQSTKAVKRRPAKAAAEGGELGGLAIVASALGHIVQASRNAELRRDKDRLLDVLRDWQRAYHRTIAQVVDLRRAFDSLRQAYDTLVEQQTQLEQENAHWKSKYSEVLRELEQARRSASAATEVNP